MDRSRHWNVPVDRGVSSRHIYYSFGYLSGRSMPCSRQFRLYNLGMHYWVEKPSQGLWKAMFTRRLLRDLPMYRGVERNPTAVIRGSWANILLQLADHKDTYVQARKSASGTAPASLLYGQFVRRPLLYLCVWKDLQQPADGWGFP